MAYIPSYAALASHPKVRRLATFLDCSKAQAIGHLHLLWWWALEYAPDGVLNQYLNVDLALAAEWEGDADHFAQGLLAAGFLDKEAGVRCYRIHDWDDYGGTVVSKRRNARTRMRKTRNGNGVTPEPIPFRPRTTPFKS